MTMKLTIDGYQNKKINKYYKWYKNIIIGRIKNPLEEGTYSENHHIIPECLGGNDNKENKIDLTAREHFIAHYLLCKFITGNGYYKVLKAIESMQMESPFHEKRYFNSRFYETIKTEISKANSFYMKERWKNPDFRNKMTESIKNSWYNGKRDEQLEFMKNNSPFKNKETHDKSIRVREERKNNIFSKDNLMLKEETKQKKVNKTSGNNHYLRKRRAYYYREIGEEEWIYIDNSNGLGNALEKLGFPYATFMKMLNGNYRPKNGTLSTKEVKREVLDNEN